MRSFHVSRKEYKCDHCGKILSDKYVLEKHLKNHSDSRKKYPCDICGKDYSDKNVLKKHKAFVHNGVTKLQTCSICKDQFKYLEHHMKVHSQNITFSCDTCGKSFRRKNTLNTHKKTHVVDSKANIESKE